jgi:hypothetical protein
VAIASAYHCRWSAKATDERECTKSRRRFASPLHCTEKAHAITVCRRMLFNSIRSPRTSNFRKAVWSCRILILGRQRCPQNTYKLFAIPKCQPTHFPHQRLPLSRGSHGAFSHLFGKFLIRSSNLLSLIGLMPSRSANSRIHAKDDRREFECDF